MTLHCILLFLRTTDYEELVDVQNLYSQDLFIPLLQETQYPLKTTFFPPNHEFLKLIEDFTERISRVREE